MLDLLRRAARHIRMAIGKTPSRILATVTIEGPAEEVLADVQRLRAGGRSVLLSVEDRFTPGRGYAGWNIHSIPRIAGGMVQEAMRKLETMSRQTVIDRDTEQRLERLIRDFGDFTRS